MCGLAAILSRAVSSDAVDGPALGRISDAMAARGPDGAGLWLAEDGAIGLAHRRLSIIDLSETAAQPMFSPDGDLGLVFNGEIYNYQALRTELESQGATFRTHSDTEVLLHLYRRDGIAMLERLRGMFAIALWDRRRQGLLLARDPFGIKPLYIADDGKCLRVASQVRALLAGGGIDASPEPAGHAGFFLWGHVPEPFTLYRGIRTVPAGSWIWAPRSGTTQSGRFFDFHRELAQATDAGPADPDILRAALLDSVCHHLVADVPVAVFLSGGLDSTTLAALAAEAAGRPPVTLTLGFDEFAGSSRDEAALAECVARSLGADHRTCRIGAPDFAASRASILADMDQPSIDGVNTWLVARETRKRGLKVALSGVGGDELFAGYDTFRQVPDCVHGLRALRSLRPLATLVRACTAWPLRLAGRPKWAGLMEYGTRFGDAYLLRRGLFAPWELPRLLDRDMAAAGLAALDPGEVAERAIAGIDSDRLKITALETSLYMRNQLLRDSDWAGMAHGVEIRTPLVDIDLFRAVLPMVAGSAPPGKRDMAATAHPPLPEAVLNRPKTGFFVPIAHWLGERNLRGWAKTVYDTFVGHKPMAG